MIPIIFVNSSSVPFVDKIMDGSKLYETRSKDMLRPLVGRRVLIAETGKGQSVVRCSARIRSAFRLDNRLAFNLFRKHTQIPEGSRYDWNADTLVKWLYELTDVRPISVPFHPAEGVRHGRVWMEYNGKSV